MAQPAGSSIPLGNRQPMYEVGPHDSILGNLENLFMRARNGQLGVPQISSLRGAIATRILDILTISARMGRPNPLLNIPEILDPSKPAGQLPPLLDESTFRLRLTEAISATAGIIPDPAYAAAVFASSVKKSTAPRPPQAQAQVQVQTQAQQPTPPSAGTPTASVGTPANMSSPTISDMSNPTSIPVQVQTPTPVQKVSVPAPLPVSTPISIANPVPSLAPVQQYQQQQQQPTTPMQDSGMVASGSAPAGNRNTQQTAMAAAANQLAVEKGFMQLPDLSRITRLGISERETLFAANPILKAKYEQTLAYYKALQQHKGRSSTSVSQPSSTPTTPNLTPVAISTPSFPQTSTPTTNSIPSTPPSQLSSTVPNVQSTPQVQMESVLSSSNFTNPATSQRSPESKTSVKDPSTAKPVAETTAVAPLQSTSQQAPTSTGDAIPSSLPASKPSPTISAPTTGSVQVKAQPPPKPAPPPETAPARVKRKIREYLSEEAPELSMEVGVDDILMQVLDSFLERVATDSVRMAVHRKSDRIETRDVAFVLDDQYNLVVPGFNAAVPKRVHLEQEGKRSRVVVPRARQKDDDA